MRMADRELALSILQGKPASSQQLATWSLSTSLESTEVSVGVGTYLYTEGMFCLRPLVSHK